jgi:hypothetical protein
MQSELTGSLSKVTEEREFLRSLNETLLSNQKEFSSKLAAAQAELKEKDAQLQDLQEQVGGWSGASAFLVLCLTSTVWVRRVSCAADWCASQLHRAGWLLPTCLRCV